MGKINWGRVILGGLLAGVVINISEWVLNEMVVKEQYTEAMKALGKSGEMAGSAIAVWILWGFVAGIIVLWLYAAIRPRFGPGPGTAARAGIAFWFVSHLLGTIAMVNMGLFPFMALPLAWTLVESILAALLGGWVYKEA